MEWMFEFSRLDSFLYNTNCFTVQMMVDVTQAEGYLFVSEGILKVPPVYETWQASLELMRYWNWPHSGVLSFDFPVLTLWCKNNKTLKEHRCRSQITFREALIGNSRFFHPSLSDNVSPALSLSASKVSLTVHFLPLFLLHPSQNQLVSLHAGTTAEGEPSTAVILHLSSLRQYLGKNTYFVY